VHPSLLPRYRGAAPIHHTILNHDKETGVTVQTLDLAKFDHGKILAQSDPPLQIGENEGYNALRARLAEEGARLLVDVLRRGDFRNPEFEGIKTSWEPSLARKVGDTEKHIDWSTWGEREFVQRGEMFGDVWCELGLADPSAERKRCLLRGGRLLGGTALEEAKEALSGLEPGMIGKLPGRKRSPMVVRTADGFVIFETLQLDGKKEMDATEWNASLKQPRRFY
jgi:methionyl-tRNA formyltransferase